MSGNDVDAKTAEDIASLVSALPTLRKLVLSDNEMEEGALSVAKAVAGHGKMTSVNMSTNCIEEDTVKDIRKVCILKCAYHLYYIFITTAQFLNQNIIMVCVMTSRQVVGKKVKIDLSGNDGGSEEDEAESGDENLDEIAEGISNVRIK